LNLRPHPYQLNAGNRCAYYRFRSRVRPSVPKVCVQTAHWYAFFARRAAAVEAFGNLLEARVLVEDWRIKYNTIRPHSALGYLTPAEYARTWTTTQPALS
jgi:transposase InsO family protein